MYHNIIKLYFYHHTYDLKLHWTLMQNPRHVLRPIVTFSMRLELNFGTTYYNLLQRGSINMTIYKDGDQIKMICIQI